MNGFDEFEITNCIATQGWRKVGGEEFELLQVIPKVDVRNIVYNIQQRNTRASIIDANQIPSGQLASSLSASSSLHLKRKIRP
ncbi:MAG: hypothetical protein L6R35_000999 [Caloplaca aegaea]|nr:MAG: hypothetical protein L6R35_000999 [Caloplaca aegaea]